MRTTTPPRNFYAQLLSTLQAQVKALATQQNFVITDPTGATGDPAHGHATVVIGQLKPITGISAFGIASYRTGAWVQL